MSTPNYSANKLPDTIASRETSGKIIFHRTFVSLHPLGFDEEQLAVFGRGTHFFQHLA